MIKLFSLLLLLTLYIQCNPSNDIEDLSGTSQSIQPSTASDPVEDHQELAYLASTDRSGLKCWNWNEITIPAYTWPDGTPFGNGLFIDTAFDPEGISIAGNQIRFYIDPLFPETPENAPSSYNYRSEIHTAPWPINHPLGTEQWIGWEYTFGDDYIIDTSSPITIFQNHPGVNGLSPQIEIEIAALNDPAPAQGGEIQVVNAASSDRFVYPVKPMAGDHLEVVIHVIYGLGAEGLLQVWLNDHLFYNKKTATVYENQPWGGNNKWGIYHHTFNNSAQDVESSVNLGTGTVELFMSPLKLLTRSPGHPEYGIDAYELVRPKD